MTISKKFFLATFLFFNQSYGYSQFDSLLSGLYYLKEIVIHYQTIDARKINPPEVVCSCGNNQRSITLAETIGAAIGQLIKGAHSSDEEYENLLKLLDNAFKLLLHGSDYEIAQATCELSSAVNYQCPMCNVSTWRIKSL